jgi:hypothetical protein
LTAIPKFDLTIYVNPVLATPLSQEQRREVACWIEQSLPSLPEPVRIFLAPHHKYLAAGGDLRRHFDATCRQLRRALGITPSSERRRSGSPLASLPGGRAPSPSSERERLEQQRDRSNHLGRWHGKLNMRHTATAKGIEEKLAKMKTEPPPTPPPEPDRDPEQKPTGDSQDVTEDTPLEEIELTEEELAEVDAEAEEFADHLELGDGAAPALQSVNETLMPGGAVVAGEEMERLAADVPEELSDATVVKTLIDQRVRYDLSVAVNRIVLDVEKQVVVKDNGQRAVISASTSQFGPPRYSVTWSALVTLAVLVGQFALPLNRLATLFSTADKQFTAGGLSRMLHYVAMRLVEIYLELAEQLADSDILAGDDTSCRVIEVSTYFKASKARGRRRRSKKKPPWAGYRTKADAEASIKRCEELERLREQRRAEGDREVERLPDGEPSLGMLIGRVLAFESPRQDGQGAKQSMNTTVISGRSIAEDPRSLIVFYRSHLGGCGNLLESILHSRSPSAGDLILQADLSTTNLIRDPELLQRFDFKLIGCSAHARRPFAQYEHEDPVYCSHLLHLFTGLAMHEDRLDVHGRNRDNVFAVRQADSRRLWEQIRELATKLEAKWSKATKLGTSARYILKHYDKLTAYLDDPRLEPTNNLRERMLRTEKLIESSSMFRRSLEGRFVLDMIRTVLQTAVAAGVPVREYLESVLRSDADEISNHPERFTPRAWAARQRSE